MSSIKIIFAAIKALPNRTPRDLWSLLFITLGTVVMAYYYVFPLDGLIPHRGDYLEDSGQMVWNLWFVTESILHLRNPFVTDIVFYPIGTNLGTHTLVSGWFPVSLLVKLLTWGSDYYPIYAFNIVVLLSYLFLVVFTFLSLRKMGFGFLVSVIPACGYAFCSFYYWHWKHLNLMAIFTLPMLLFLGLRLWEKTTGFRALLFTLGLAWSVYLTEMSVFIAMALLLFLLVALPFASLRRPLMGKLMTLGLLKIALCLILFLLLVWPFLYYYFTSDAEAPSYGDFSAISANVAALFIPGIRGTALYGSLFDSLCSKITTGLAGREVFIGFPMILFTLVGLWGKKPAPYWVCFALALFFITLGFGPTLKLLGVDTKIVMPYGWLMKIPPFTQNRCPVRIVIIGTFFLTPLVAYGLQRTYQRISHTFNRWAAIGILMAVLVWTILETYTFPPNERIIYRVDRLAIESMVDGPAITTSLPSRACNEGVLQIFHKKPIAGFCYARTSLKQRAYMKEIWNSMKRDAEAFAIFMKKKGFKNILVDKRLPFVEVESLRVSGLRIIELVDHPERAAFEIGAQLPENRNQRSKGAVWRIKQGGEQVVTLKEQTTVSAIEMRAATKDVFSLSLFAGKRHVTDILLGAIVNERGIKWKIHDFPKGKKPVIDKIVIKPQKGKAPFSISAFVVATDEV